MTDDRDQPGPAPVIWDEAVAKRRFLTIGLMRMGGVAMILFAILVLTDTVLLPLWAGYLLLVLGLVETFLVPHLLARLWSSNPDRRGSRK